jgi:ribosomal protein S7
MNYILNKVFNSFTKNGNKQKSEKNVFKALKIIKLKKKKTINSLFKIIFRNCRSEIELVDPAKRKNKKKYPFFIKFKRNNRVIIKSLAKSVGKRYNFKLSERIKSEYSDAFEGKGLTVLKKNSIYQYTLENRAFVSRMLPRGKSSRNKKKRLRY